MGEIDRDYSEIPPLEAMVDGARHFGLTDGEILEAVDESVYEVGTDATVTELLDELTGALARAIVAKQQRTLFKDPVAAPEQRRTPSRDPR
ncbi:MAG: hypothetical protein ACRDN8_09940 [Thermoleophilaceae bacterium]